jgi:VanZ family protein
VFVLSRFAQTTDVIVGALAALAGWRLSRSLNLSRLGSTLTSDGWLGRAAAAALLLTWMAIVAYASWEPFDFRLSWSEALHRLGQVSVVPFADYHVDTEYHTFEQALKKGLLYVPLGAIAACSAGRARRGLVVGVLALSATVALVFEVGQAFQPTRYPSLTDVLLEASSAGLSFVAVRALTYCPRCRIQHGGSS